MELVLQVLDRVIMSPFYCLQGPLPNRSCWACGGQPMGREADRVLERQRIGGGCAEVRHFKGPQLDGLTLLSHPASCVCLPLRQSGARTTWLLTQFHTFNFSASGSSHP